MKREHFFVHVYFSNETVSQPDNCINLTNENVSFGAQNYECLSQKCGMFWSRGVQV